MKLFVYIVLAVVAFELALALSDKERGSIADRIRYRVPNRRIQISDNSRLFDIRKYFKKVKNTFEKVVKEFGQPMFSRKGDIIGRRQQWDVKFGK